jgi:hypothetical protein
MKLLPAEEPVENDADTSVIYQSSYGGTTVAAMVLVLAPVDTVGKEAPNRSDFAP